MNPERDMNQTVTHWAVTGSDGFSGFTFSAPLTLQCRWEDRAVQYRDKDNQQVVSNAVVYVPSDLDIGDYLALGDHTASSTPVIANDGPAGTIARRIEQYQRVTDLKNLLALRTAYL